MSRLILLAVLSIGLSASISAPSLAQKAVSAPPRRVAFLVGVNEYDKNGFKTLDWAENDANEMGRELIRLGFDSVVTLTGSDVGEVRATKENIEKQLDALLKSVKKTDIVVVMLSGHGRQMTVTDSNGKSREDGFFCPADAVFNEAESMISLSWLTDHKLNGHAARNLVMVDACRDSLVVVDNDKGTKTKGIEGRTVSLPEGTAILFSCSAGQSSIERADLKHGVFAYSALEVLRAFDGSGKDLTLYALVEGVLNGVSDLNVEQAPIMAGSMPRLVLVPGRGRRVARAEGIKAGEEREDNGLKMKLLWCPPGQFSMGSPENEPNHQSDENQVEVTFRQGFWLGRFEVKQSQWRDLMGDVPSAPPAEGGPDYGTGPDHPVYWVGYEEANAFCRKLTETEQRAGRLPADCEYRLPSEAQWEYACRAGTTSATAFGDKLGSLEANFDGNSPYNGAPVGPYLLGTSSVGAYRANAWGFYDMYGNVHEWCRDGYVNRLQGGENPEGDSAAPTKVVRGGGWGNTGESCRSGYRMYYEPTKLAPYIGFRVALVLKRP